MPTTFRPCAPGQSLLFPPCPRDWLPEGHLAFFIADTVAALDLQAFYAPYEGDGRRNQPFDPQMIVFAGGMILAGDDLFDRVRKVFEHYTWSIGSPLPQIVPSQLGNDAGFIGAAAVARDKHTGGLR